MKKIIYTLILLVFVSSFAQAQNDMKARIEFEEAEKAFEAEDYEKCITHIEETERLIGQWTPMTSFLKIEALNNLVDIGYRIDVNRQPLYVEVSKYMAHMNKLDIHKVPSEKYKKVYEIEKALKVHKLDERQVADFIKAKDLHDAENYDGAIPLYEKLVQQNNSWAMRNLGLIYELKKDYPNALTWYKKALENGNSAAALALATLDMEGGKSDAREWHEQASRLGHPYAMYCEGWYSENRDENMQKAMEYYLRAAALGSADGFIGVGYLYQKGKGVPIDFKKAEEYYLKAVKKNRGFAMYRIGYLYYLGGNGIIEDFQIAMEWFLKAVDRNNSDAMVNIGWIYQHGLGNFQKDYGKAEEWYLKAVESGDKYTYLFLGDLYSIADNRQPQKALENFEKAREIGHLRGALETAHIYYLGNGGITKDYVKAAMYYEAYFSSENRDKENDTYLDNLINIYNRGGHGAEKDKEKTKYWKDFKKT